MLALEYGYPVLPGAALDTPAVAEVLRSRERGLRRGGWAMAAEAALLVAVLAAAGPGSPLAVGTVVALVPVFAVTAGLTLLWQRARRRERLVLATYGWQVWPCAGREVRVVAGEGERAGGRRWASDGRVVLLGPDGQSVCSFPPPGADLDGPTPAVGREVWFAGDTRFGGVLALPGGMPFRYVTRAKPGRRQGSAAEDELARRAGLLRRG
ncbi:hypothetical protein AB0D54_15145 [Streptomyces xanthophaeus]|uniref:hypothetical protein n=1 Tax=Streptomyces xanthophaeus TaxID=67385 RepID=UPI00343A8F82